MDSLVRRHSGSLAMETQGQIETHYRIQEAAKLLHVSRATIYNLIRGRRVVRLGRGRQGILIPESVLKEIIKGRTNVFR